MKRLLFLPDRLLARGIDIALLAVRIAVGVVFIAHGGQKLFVNGLEGTAQFFGSVGIPFPALNAALAAITEFGGGILILFGLLTRWISIPVAFTMVVAFITVHGKNGFFLPSGFEYVFVLFLLNLALLFGGAGRFSLDALLHSKLGALESE